jgi:hypothetical protein
VFTGFGASTRTMRSPIDDGNYAAPGRKSKDAKSQTISGLLQVNFYSINISVNPTSTPQKESMK